MKCSIQRIAPAVLYHLPPAPAPPPARASTPALLFQLDAPPVQLQTFNQCAPPTTSYTATFWSKCTLCHQLHLHLQLRMLNPNYYLSDQATIFVVNLNPHLCVVQLIHGILHARPISKLDQSAKKRHKHFPQDQVHLPLPGIFPIHRGVGDLPCLLHVILQILRQRMCQEL